MEYDKLYEILPTQPKVWSIEDVGKWLNFIGCGYLYPLFKQQAVDGSCLEILMDNDLIEIGVDQVFRRKKILQWVQIGFGEYNQYIKIRSKEVRSPSSIQNPQFQNVVRQPLQNTNMSYLIQSNANYNSQVLDEKSCQINSIPRHQFVPSHAPNPRFNLEKPQFPNQQSNTISSGVGTLNRPLDQSFCEYRNEDLNVQPKRRSQKRIFETPKETQIQQQSQGDPNLPKFGTPKFDKTNQQDNADEEEYQYNKEKNPPPAQIPTEFSILLIKKLQDKQNEPPFVVGKENCQFGRSPDCLIQLTHETASRIHAWIIFKDGQYFLQDRGSLSGTFIFLQGRILLKQGFILQVGSFEYLLQSVVVNGKGNQTNINLSDIVCNIILLSEAGTFSLELEMNETIVVFGKTNIASLAHDQQLSNQHCQFSFCEEGVVVEDLSSDNGTWLRLSKENVQSLNFPIQLERIIRISGQYFQLTPK